MPGETISQIPSASGVSGGDILPATQGSSGPATGTTRGITVDQLGSFLGNLYLLLTGGNLTGSVVMSAGDFTVVVGNITVVAGDLTVPAGNITIGAGTLFVGGAAILNGDVQANGTLSVSGQLNANDGLRTTNGVTLTGGSGDFECDLSAAVFNTSSFLISAGTVTIQANTHLTGTLEVTGAIVLNGTSL